MKHLLLAGALALAGLLALVGAAAAGAAPPVRGSVALDMYTARVAPDVYAGLLDKGYDVVSAEDVAGGVVVELVLTKAQADA